MMWALIKAVLKFRAVDYLELKRMSLSPAFKWAAIALSVAVVSGFLLSACPAQKKEVALKGALSDAEQVIKVERQVSQANRTAVAKATEGKTKVLAQVRQDLIELDELKATDEEVTSWADQPIPAPVIEWLSVSPNDDIRDNPGLYPAESRP